MPAISSTRKTEHRAVVGTFNLRRDLSWKHGLNEAGVPASRVRTLFEALADPQLKDRAVLQPTTGFPGLAAGVRVPVSATTWRDDGPELHSPPPTAGQHGEAILHELNYADDDIDRFRAAGVI